MSLKTITDPIPDFRRNKPMFQLHILPAVQSKRVVTSFKFYGPARGKSILHAYIRRGSKKV
jgi:hypothetical protein